MTTQPHSHGRNKVKARLRSELDCVFFAGPCAGRSAWNRLNSTISDKAAAQVKRHQQLYWKLREHFADALEHVLSIDACALTELPRRCEYWNDRRMTQLVNGTESHTHTFDGIMSWSHLTVQRKGFAHQEAVASSFVGVHFKDLQKTCDGRHQHVPCDTRVTQMYTFRIDQTILETLNKRSMSLWKKKRAPSQPPKLHDWSMSPHPLLRGEEMSSEASLSKRFGRIIQAVHESKKKTFILQPCQIEPEPCASVCAFISVVSHSSNPNCESHFGRTVVQKLIGKNVTDFYSVLAFGPRDAIAVRSSFADERNGLIIMSGRTGEEQRERGLYISSVYGQVRKSRASATNFKALMLQLFIQRDQKPLETSCSSQDLSKRTWTKWISQSCVGNGKEREFHLPTAYLACASYASQVGSQEIIDLAAPRWGGNIS